MKKYKTLFLTHRAPVHQRLAIEAAPGMLDITMLRDPAKKEIIEAIREADFLITEREDVIDREIIENTERLKLITRLGSRVWDIDLEAACERGIPVCRLPLNSCIHVAEHIIMQMLTLARRARESMDVMNTTDWNKEPRLCTEDLFAYNWSDRSGMGLLWNSTAGILGFGEIGNELAVRLKAFGCRVEYNKRTPLPREAENALDINYRKKEELIGNNDFVVSLLPFIPGTERSIDTLFFNSMKAGSFFVHCGGSGVVQEEAVINALKSGRLAGAALDTFSWEPVRDYEPILELSRDPRVNLVLTPHVAAGGTDMKKANPRAVYYENIIHCIEGKPLTHQVV